MTLELEPTADILAELARSKQNADHHRLCRRNGKRSGKRAQETGLEIARRHRRERRLARRRGFRLRPQRGHHHHARRSHRGARNHQVGSRAARPGPGQVRLRKVARPALKLAAEADSFPALRCAAGRAPVRSSITIRDCNAPIAACSTLDPNSSAPLPNESASLLQRAGHLRFLPSGTLPCRSTPLKSQMNSRRT